MNERHPARVAATIFAFDLLWHRGRIIGLARLLNASSAGQGAEELQTVVYADHFKDSCTELWDLANRLKLEGIMAKDAQSPYTCGRSSRWLKIRTEVGAERERQRRP